MHFATEHAANAVEQHLLAGGAEHAQCLLVHIDDADLLHAAGHEVGVHLEEGLEVADALGTHTIEQILHNAEVLHPERDRRMLEQVARVLLAAPQAARCLQLLGVVLQRDQHAAPVCLMARQDARADQHVQTAAVERIVHRLVGKLHLPVPQLRQFMHRSVVPVVTKDFVEVGFQMLLAVGREQLQRAPIDLQHTQRRTALAQAGRVFGQMGAYVRHPLCAPAIEQTFEFAEILQPERHGRQLEHVFVIGPRG